MSTPSILVVILIAVGSVIALISGKPFLEAPLPGGLPVGNLLSAVAFCSLAFAAVGLGRPETTLRYLSIASLVAASAWLPASIVLAGNPALNFGGSRGQVWIWLTLGVSALVLSATVGASIDRLIRRRLERRSTDQRLT